jgi:peptidoglycan/LPS O-acetylase OafA/YrhL
MNAVHFDARPNAIGFLRLLLAGMVIYSHAYLLGGFGPELLSRWSHGTTIAGFAAVQAFFVLSGWLLTQSWRHRPQLVAFLRNRALRLLPAFWVCLIVTACLLAPLVFLTTPEHSGSFWSQTPAPLGYIARNLIQPRTQIGIGSLLASVPWPGDWNGSLWTLYYEGACYLALAAAGAMGLLTCARATGTAAIVSLMLLNIVWHLTPGVMPAIVGRLFDTPGKLLVLHFAAGGGWALWPGSRAAGWRSGTVIGLAMLTLAASWRLGGYAWLSPWLLPPVVIWLAENLPLRGWEEKLGGDYSYGLYVYGFPVQQLLVHFGANQAGLAVFFMASLTGAGLLAVASWHGAEKIALSWKATRAAVVPVPLAP